MTGFFSVCVCALLIYSFMRDFDIFSGVHISVMTGSRCTDSQL